MICFSITLNSSVPENRILIREKQKPASHGIAAPNFKSFVRINHFINKRIEILVAFNSCAYLEDMYQRQCGVGVSVPAG